MTQRLGKDKTLHNWRIKSVLDLNVRDNTLAKQAQTTHVGAGQSITLTSSTILVTSRHIEYIAATMSVAAATRQRIDFWTHGYT